MVIVWLHGLLASYVKLLIAHAPGMPGTFSPPPRFSDPGMHHDTCVTHVPWCMPGSLTSGFLWSWRRGKRSRHSRRMRNPQFDVSGKRPIQTKLVQVQVTCFRHISQYPVKLEIRSYVYPFSQGSETEKPALRNGSSSGPIFSWFIGEHPYRRVPIAFRIRRS